MHNVTETMLWEVHKASMKLCSYVLVHDTGFAPNPFWGFCTLAVCTPNHMGLRLRSSDWIVGHGSAALANRLIYAMRVSEVLDFDRYFHDPRIEKKKPSQGTWQQQCGDNIYRRQGEGWVQEGSLFHTSR
jgi:hypothetical protein